MGCPTRSSSDWLKSLDSQRSPLPLVAAQDPQPQLPFERSRFRQAVVTSRPSHTDLLRHNLCALASSRTMVECPSSAPETLVADHFEEVIGLRVSELEGRVAAEAQSVKEHFAELQSFVTFSLTRQTAELRTELAQQAAELRAELARQTG